MFDISFAELIIVGVVALIVIGPEKLPKVARTAGMLFGRAQRMASSFRADLERELHTSEIAELQKKMAEEAANFRDEMAESAAQVNDALGDPGNRILPEPLAENPAPALPAIAEDADQTAATAPKPRRRRKPVQPQAEAAATTELPMAESVPALPNVEPPAPKKPRKRKAAEPQVDLFAEAPADPESTDWGDRR